MKTTFKKLIAASFCITIFFNGIRRHDVKETNYLKLASQKQFDCVGKVLTEKGELEGSCVLIGKKFVLSAAHVFMEYTFREDSGIVKGTYMKYQVLVSSKPGSVTKTNFSFKGKNYQGKSIKIFPAYLDSATKRSCDLALIELEENVLNIQPAAIGTSSDELHSTVFGAGFGVSGPANEPENVKQLGKKIAGENVIDSLSGYKFNGKFTLLFADFDHPTNKNCNRMGSSQPTPLEYSVGGGDSGGGLFRKTKNGFELIGITSGSPIQVDILMKTGYYGQIMSWTRVSVFSDWINSNIKD